MKPNPFENPEGNEPWSTFFNHLKELKSPEGEEFLRESQKTEKKTLKPGIEIEYVDATTMCIMDEVKIGTLKKEDSVQKFLQLPEEQSSNKRNIALAKKYCKFLIQNGLNQDIQIGQLIEILVERERGLGEQIISSQTKEPEPENLKPAPGDPKPHTPAAKYLKKMEEAGDPIISKEFFGNVDFARQIEIMLEKEKAEKELEKLLTIEVILTKACKHSDSENLTELIYELESILTGNRLVVNPDLSFPAEDITECISYLKSLLKQKIKPSGHLYEALEVLSLDKKDIQEKIVKCSRLLKNPKQ
jgi:hypothetical protein